VDGEAGTGVQLLVANVTFEMLRLLVLDQNLFVVKLAVAVPAPGLALLLLLSSHDVTYCDLVAFATFMGRSAEPGEIRQLFFSGNKVFCGL